MLSYISSLAFLSLLIIPIGIFFLTLIQLTIEDVRGTKQVKVRDVNNYTSQEFSSPRLRVVK